MRFSFSLPPSFPLSFDFFKKFRCCSWQSVWPDVEIKKWSNFPKVAQKSSPSSFYLNRAISKQPKKSLKIWVNFLPIFVTKTFQKQLNLVTLLADLLSLQRRAHLGRQGVGQAETTVYSDRLLLHYLPISDAFDNIENFFCIKQMIQLRHY